MVKFRALATQSSRPAALKMRAVGLGTKRLVLLVATPHVGFVDSNVIV